MLKLYLGFSTSSEGRPERRELPLQRSTNDVVEASKHEGPVSRQSSKVPVYSILSKRLKFLALHRSSQSALDATSKLQK